jgi:hypothetical protein
MYRGEKLLQRLAKEKGYRVDVGEGLLSLIPLRQTDKNRRVFCLTIIL